MAGDSETVLDGGKTKIPEQLWSGTSRKVWEDHEELFHYTNRKGLDGILKSQTIFATHYAYLNDVEEMILFKSALKNILIPRTKTTIETWMRQGKMNVEGIEKEGGVLRLCNIEIDGLIEIMNKALLGRDGREGIAIPFICSFCSHANDKERSRDGLLSQWRGYSREGGYAIVFDTKNLNDLLKKESETRSYSPFGWGDVIYQGDEERLQRELGEQVKILSDFMLALVHARAFDATKQNYPHAGLKELVAHAVCIALYKHSGFKEEKEVRIYAYRPTEGVIREAMKLGRKLDNPPAKMQQIKHGKKYIELFKDFGVKLPIKRIIVGPQRNKEKIADELRKLVDMRIDTSGIPYVEQSWME